MKFEKSLMVGIVFLVAGIFANEYLSSQAYLFYIILGFPVTLINLFMENKQ